MNEPSSLDFISHIYFLTMEARKGVRFLMRRSPCNPEAII
jgi:hypothetical protein